MSFATDENGRFAIDIPFGAYEIEFTDTIYYNCRQSIDYSEDFVVDATYGDFLIEEKFQEYKPNIYIYPEQTIDLDVSLDFPQGGEVTTSIPEYGAGWSVTVEPSGLIDGKYDYLFYEAQNPDMYQYDNGWVVSQDELESFFRDNLAQTCFIKKEIDDFVDYWIPLLRDYPYYAIYPQYSKDIDKMIRLGFSIQPDNVLRLFYSIKGLDSKNVSLPAPEIPQFARTGFVVAEWGVVIK